MPDAQPSFQFVDMPQQQDVAQLGIWVFLATEVLFFGGLILAYCAYRSGYPDGFAEAARHTEIVIGTANTAILLTSSFFVAWAVSVSQLNASRFAALLLWSFRWKRMWTRHSPSNGLARSNGLVAIEVRQPAPCPPPGHLLTCLRAGPEAPRPPAR